MVNRIYYQEGFKYQLVKPYAVETGIKIPSTIDTQFLHLSAGGLLRQNIGWAWDGISGSRDVISGMRGSCGHDGLYTLMRLGLLPRSCQEQVDDIFHRDCIEDDMSHFRADFYRGILNHVGHYACHPDNVKDVFVAPRPKTEVEIEYEETY